HEDESPAYYRVQTLAADPAAPDARALDPRATVDGLVWVAILRPERGPAPDLHEKPLCLGFVPDAVVGDMADVDACPGAGGPAGAPAMVWRASSATIDEGDLRYLAVTVLGDSTRGLTRPGVVTVRLPGGIGVPELADPALAGTGNLPPAVADDVAPRVMAWL